MPELFEMEGFRHFVSFYARQHQNQRSELILNHAAMDMFRSKGKFSDSCILYN